MLVLELIVLLCTKLFLFVHLEVLYLDAINILCYYFFLAQYMVFLLKLMT